jgi:hypothetical protein
MPNTALTVLTACLLTAAVMTPMLAQESKPPLSLKVGDVAPDFKLQYFDGHDLKDVTLGQYHGKKNVALAFYVFAFTGG